jgi:hypothetical protein
MLVGLPDPGIPADHARRELPCVADVCRIERQGLVTLDLDFADIRRYPRSRFSKIIIGLTKNARLDAMADYVNTRRRYAMSTARSHSQPEVRALRRNPVSRIVQ